MPTGESVTSPKRGEVTLAQGWHALNRPGQIVIAVNKDGTDIEPLLSHAENTQVNQTTWGDLDAEIAKEIDAAKAANAS
ncbi:MAG: hypothetical protein WCF36_20890 [Candidatus Nanopelagicales bacterium]